MNSRGDGSTSRVSIVEGLRSWYVVIRSVKSISMMRNAQMRLSE